MAARERARATTPRYVVGPSALIGVMGLTLLAAQLLRRRRARPVLFMHTVSAPARAALSLVKACKLGERAIELKRVALERGEHKSPAFLQVNPNGSVPALKDGDLRIGESHTIMRFITKRFPVDDRWYPQDARTRARVDEQLDWHHAHSRKGVPYFFHRYIVAPFFGGKPDREAEAIGKEAYLQALAFLNRHQLAKRRFLAADHITIADLACYAELGPMYWDDDLGPRIKALPNVVAWMARIRAEPWHDDVHGEVIGLVRRGAK
ncbi:hypothetical protein KFE25_005606 [Diacronema lutheri]|uniref:Glutathione S-transferase n=1 Tax=Diacronema lutheri TaxID=2081491 RepID=A0A8J5XKH5_DIALT|nr:hypothetical protein KFE25_005606 [Diacronema lutheri]